MPSSTLCVGADVHQNTICLHFLDQADGHTVTGALTIPNNRPGAEQAIAALVPLLTQHGYTQLAVAMEATGLLWLPFHTHLAQSPALAPFHPHLVCFNPKLVAKFKEGLGLATDKTDPLDAQTIADRLRFGRLPTSYVPNATWQALRRLTRYRYRLARLLAREKVRALSQLFLKASEWRKDKPFSDPFGATSATLVTQFSVNELATMPLDELAAFIDRQGRKHFDDPVAMARAVRQVLTASYPVTPDLDDALTAVLSVALEHIRDLEKLLRRLDREIAQRLERIPNPLVSVRGLGAVISAGILAEISDIHRFPDHPQLAKFVGLVWRQRASGAFVAEETRLSKQGNVYLRYYLIEGANLMRQHNLEYQAYYWRKHDEVPKHQHKRALVLTARKLVRLVHALLVTNQPYTKPQVAPEREADTEAD